MSQLLYPLHTPLAITQLILVPKVLLQGGRADKKWKICVTFPVKMRSVSEQIPLPHIAASSLSLSLCFRTSKV